MSRTQRAALLVRTEGLSPAEAADILGISRQSVCEALARDGEIRRSGRKVGSVLGLTATDRALELIAGGASLREAAEATGLRRHTVKMAVRRARDRAARRSG